MSAHLNNARAYIIISLHGKKRVETIQTHTLACAKTLAAAAVDGKGHVFGGLAGLDSSRISIFL